MSAVEPDRPTDRIRRTAAGTVIAAGLLGLRDALEGRPEREEPVLEADDAGEPPADGIELFLDPGLRMPSVSVAWKLAKRAAGFRTLLDVIPLDATLVRGSHGRSGDWDEDGPLIASRSAGLLGADRMTSVDVHDVILRHIFEDR